MPPPGRRRRSVFRRALLLTILVLAAALAAVYPWHSRSGSAGPTGPVRLARTITVAPFGDALGSLAFSPHGRMLAALGFENAYLYNLTTHRRAGIWRTLDTVHNMPTDLAFSPDGKALIISNNGDRSGYVWDIATGAVTAAFPNPPNASIYNTSLSPDGMLLAESSDQAGQTYLWNMATRHYTGVLTDPDFSVDPLAFNPDGTILAVGDGAGGDPGPGYGRIALWDVASRTIRASYQDPDHAEVQSVAFSPDGALLAASGIRQTYQWDVTTGQLIQTLASPPGAVIRQIEFSPDGHLVAAIVTSNTACIWNVTTGKIVATMPDPANTEIASLAYSPDGKTLAVGDYNSHIYLWNVSQTDREPQRK
jgi:WD40 repeat protein